MHGCLTYFKIQKGEKMPNTSQSSTGSSKKKKWSLGTIILLVLLFPVLLYIIIDGIAESSGAKPATRKKIRIGYFACLGVILLGIGGGLIIHNAQEKADISNYSISIEGAEDGEITVDCNIIDGSRDCEEIKINGSYTIGNKRLTPATNDSKAKIYLKENGSFYISFKTSLENSTEENQVAPVEICFSDSSHYCFSYSGFKDYPKYNLIINVNITDKDRQKVKALEEQEAQQKQEEERKKQEEAEKKKAEEEARRAEQQASNNSSSGGTSSSSSSSSTGIDSTKSYTLATINEGEKCPSNVRFCNIAGNSLGYTQYGYGYMRGKLINNTGKSYSYVQITADIYNSAGAKIGDCLDNTSGLGAGETWVYEAYCTGWSSGATVRNGDVSAW